MLEEALRKAVRGEVRTDAVSRRIYSVDASIFEIEPIAVVIPEDSADVKAAIAVAAKYRAPIIPRGAATGITGGCIGRGIILDLSKKMNRILEIDYQNRWALCEPGLVQDRLNEALAARGYRLGPDTSTGNRATLGGMLANNAAGARSLKYGTMADHILAATLELASGDTLHLKEGEALPPPLAALGSEYADAIKKRTPRIPRSVSGYNLAPLLEAPPNPAKLVAGSEGTLGVVTKMRVRITKIPKKSRFFLLFFDSLPEAMEQVTAILEKRPISIELIDRKILEAAGRSPAMKGRLGWLRGSPEAVLAAEFENNETLDYPGQLVTDDPALMEDVWAVRKSGLGLLLSKRAYSRAIAFIEDISVAPEKLAPFIKEFLATLQAQGKEAGIYGHAGSGCLHIRPYIDLRDPKELETMQQIMKETTALLKKYGGALSGEHGDGLVRSWLNETLFGEELYEAFVRFKKIFDPEGIMNPGKIVDAPLPLESLRLSPEKPVKEIRTFQDFSEEGGFSLAVDLCNGNALCRKQEGLMCPSFQATGDEYDSTRARAQTLRSLIHGELPLKMLSGKELERVLELCIECKGCKKECPSQVDMAKIKAEVLYRRGASLRSRLFGHIGALSRLLSPFAPLVNLLQKNRLLKSLAGIAPKRPLPPLAKKRFSRQRLPQKNFEKKAVLFNDTFNEYYTPEIGRSAAAVLAALGYQTLTPPWSCCARPLVSKGLLKQARKKMERLVALLHPYAEKGLPLIFLEPSCFSAVKDDLKNIVSKPFRKKAEEVAEAALLFDSFVAEKLPERPLNFEKAPLEVLLHGHCHQKALVGTEAARTLLNHLPGVTFREIPSGCCGVAGSFGYEKEHYAISMKIGELKLLPAVRESALESCILADGSSCRSQISHGAGRNALHLAQLIESRLQPLKR